MKEAEKNLNQMEKICGIFTCPCGKNNAVVEPSKVFGKIFSLLIKNKRKDVTEVLTKTCGRLPGVKIYLTAVG